MSFSRALAIPAAVLWFLGLGSAQIIEERQIGNKTVTCMHSGLTSDLKDCGMRSDWYSYVFVGSISVVRSVKNDEKEIQTIPEEVFSGKPPNPLTIRTSQAPCLPTLAVGDRWLFFLRQENGKPIVLDYYGNDSSPVSNAQTEIETLRRLQTIGNFAILRGRVVRGSYFERKAIPLTRVVAQRTSDKMLFVTTTSSDGRYEFQPLPPGKYKFTADAIGPIEAEEGEIDVPRAACWDQTLSKRSHAQLGGHVRHSDGSPMPDVDVLITNADNSWFTTTKTDAEGYFQDDWLQPGKKYVVGINLPGAPAWKYGGGAGAGLDIPAASLYYPGVQNCSAALAIELRPDEKRKDIDFSISPQ